MKNVLFLFLLISSIASAQQRIIHKFNKVGVGFTYQQDNLASVSPQMVTRSDVNTTGTLLRIFFNNSWYINVLSTDSVVINGSGATGSLVSKRNALLTSVFPSISGGGGGGGGAVSTVNGQSGDVVLNQDNISDGTTNKAYTATEKSKLAGVAAGATAVTNYLDSASVKNRIKDSLSVIRAALADTATIDLSLYALKTDLQDATAKGLQALGSTIKGVTIGITYTLQGNYGIALENTAVVMSAIYIGAPTTLNGVKTIMKTQGAYTASGYNGVGIYSVSGGTLSLVASSADDGNIWKAGSGNVITKAFSSPYVAAPGVYYAALIYNRSAETTPPQIAHVSTAYVPMLNTNEFTNGRFICAKYYPGVAFQSTVSASTISSTSALPDPAWMAIY